MFLIKKRNIFKQFYKVFVFKKKKINNKKRVSLETKIKK